MSDSYLQFALSAEPRVLGAFLPAAVVLAASAERLRSRQRAAPTLIGYGVGAAVLAATLLVFLRPDSAQRGPGTLLRLCLALTVSVVALAPVATLVRLVRRTAMSPPARQIVAVLGGAVVVAAVAPWLAMASACLVAGGCI